MANPVPTYQSEGRLPPSPLAAQVNPAAMTQDLAAQAQLGQGIAGLGSKALSQLTAEERRKQTERRQDERQLENLLRAAEVGNSTNAFGLQIEQDLLSVANDPNYLTAPTRAGQSWDAVIAEEAQKHQDPRVRVAAQNRMEAMKFKGLGDMASIVARKENKKQVDIGFTNFNNALKTQEFDRAWDILEGPTGLYTVGRLDENQRQQWLRDVNFAEGAALGDSDKANRLLYDTQNPHAAVLSPESRAMVASSFRSNRRYINELGDQAAEAALAQDRKTLRDMVDDDKPILAHELPRYAPAISEDPAQVKAYTSLKYKSPKFQTKGYAAAFNNITQYWEDGVLKDKDTAHEALFQQRYIEGNLDDTGYDFFKTLIDLDVPVDVVKTMSSSMDALVSERTEKGWFFGFDWLDTTEQKQVVRYMGVMSDWLKRNTDATNNKYPSSRETYQQSEVAASLVKQGKD